MHPGPRMDSKKFDIAVGDNDYAQRPSGAQPLRQFKIRKFEPRETGCAEPATDWPDRPAGDEDGSRLTRKRHSHFFTCGQNVLHVRFQIVAEINMHPSFKRHRPGAAHDLTQILH